MRHGRPIQSAATGPGASMSRAVFTDADQIASSCGSLDRNDPSASAGGASTHAVAATATITRKDMVLSYRVPVRGAMTPRQEAVKTSGADCEPAGNAAREIGR